MIFDLDFVPRSPNPAARDRPRAGVPVVGLAAIAVLGIGLLGCGPSDSNTASSPSDRTRQLRAEAPPEVANRLVAGQKAYRNGQFRLALAYADSARASMPELADPYFLKAQIYTELNQYERAAEAYEQTLARDESYRGARLNLGINLLRRDSVRSALEWFERARSRFPSSGLFIEMGRAYSELGRQDSARWAFRRAIRMDSSNATAYMWMSRELERAGRIDSAIHVARQGVRLRPERLNYRYQLGRQLVQSNQPEPALRYLQPVADSLPWHQAAQINMARALRQLDRTEEAARYDRRFDSAQTMVRRFQDARSAAEQQPQNPERWIDLAEANRQAERYEQAKQAYEVAVSLSPGNLGIRNNLANLHLTTGDTARALSTYRSILDIDSTITPVWLNLGALYTQIGRFDRAREVFRRARNQDPENPQIQAYLDRVERLQERQ